MEVEVRLFLPATGSKKNRTVLFSLFLFLPWVEGGKDGEEENGVQAEEKKKLVFGVEEGEPSTPLISSSSPLFMLRYSARVSAGFNIGEKQICSQELLFK